MINRKNALEVRCINKKLLKQIRLIPYDGKVYRQLMEDLLTEKLQARFWFDGQALNMGSLKVLWLVEGPQGGEYSIILPPESGPVFDKYSSLSQLFVS